MGVTQPEQSSVRAHLGRWALPACSQHLFPAGTGQRPAQCVDLPPASSLPLAHCSVLPDCLFWSKMAASGCVHRLWHKDTELKAEGQTAPRPTLCMM